LADVLAMRLAMFKTLATAQLQKISAQVLSKQKRCIKKVPKLEKK